jgi:hypothetical protein
MKNNKTLIERLIEAGYPKENMFHHCSDLYIFVTDVSEKVVKKWANENNIPNTFYNKFKDNVTGKIMYDLPFQWMEFFNRLV